MEFGNFQRKCCLSLEKLKQKQDQFSAELVILSQVWNYNLSKYKIASTRAWCVRKARNSNRVISCIIKIYYLIVSSLIMLYFYRDEKNQ